MGFIQEETKIAIGKGCRFYVWLIGTGEGCDDYIACNERLQPLWAKTLERAKEEVAVIVGEGGHIDAVIIEASHLHIFDIDTCLAEAEERLQQKAQNEQESADRAEYERLQTKLFGEKDERQSDS